MKISSYNKFIIIQVIDLSFKLERSEPLELTEYIFFNLLYYFFFLKRPVLNWEQQFEVCIRI